MQKDRSLEGLKVIMIGAHPDDCELKAGASAARWAEEGARVQLVSLTNGDAGHHISGGGELARRRMAEAACSAEILGVSSLVLDYHDGELTPTLDLRRDVIRSIRRWQADVVISHRPNDYHPDHRYAAQVVQDAAYMVLVPNVCPDAPPLAKNPVFMYFPDHFRKPLPFRPDVIVDATSVMEKKIRSLDAMDSQMYEWLPWIDRQLDQVPADHEKRLEYLKSFWAEHFRSSAQEFKDLLVERYGPQKAARVQYAEAFELCEYGGRPSREELWRLFPR
ncbi:MAG TPA: PIG-L deacetylase family protein [Candidatus Glassbacteria bacterium]|nr:PIG-L deacetylase family protein [Candidatus Glassbacteria bacterium]